MKVKELIEQLQKLNPEFEVIQQKDPEGNGYAPMEGIEEFWYDPEYNEPIHDNDYEDYKYVAIRAVVAWPSC